MAEKKKQQKKILKERGEKDISKITTFPVPFIEEAIKKNITINSNIPKKKI